MLSRVVVSTGEELSCEGTAARRTARLTARTLTDRLASSRGSERRRRRQVAVGRLVTVSRPERLAEELAERLAGGAGASGAASRGSYRSG